MSHLFLRNTSYFQIGGVFAETKSKKGVVKRTKRNWRWTLPYRLQLLLLLD